MSLGRRRLSVREILLQIVFVLHLWCSHSQAVLDEFECTGFTSDANKNGYYFKSGTYGGYDVFESRLDSNLIWRFEVGENVYSESTSFHASRDSNCFCPTGHGQCLEFVHSCTDL